MFQALQDLDGHVKLIAGIATGVLILAGLVRIGGRKAKKTWDEAVGVKQVLLGRPAIIDKRTKAQVAEAVEGIGPLMKRTLDGVADLSSQLAGLRADVEHVIGKVHTIEHEVQFNNGSSIKDATVRTEEAVNRVEGATQELREEFVEVRDRLHRGDEKFIALEAVLQAYAEAQKTLWPAIQAIAEARPPSD